MCAVYPWSHNKLMDNSAPDGKLGNMCAILAPSRKDGNNNSQVCEEIMSFPSINLTEIG